MEKIYETKTNPRKKAFTGKNVTIGLTLGVALIAIISVLALSVSRNSYALDEVTSSLPTEVTTELAGEKITGEQSLIELFPYRDQTSEMRLYCLESKVGFQENIKMTKENPITDKGLIYLSARVEKIKVSASDFEGITEDQAKAIETWTKQNAFWYYLAAINAEGSDPEYNAKMEAVKNEKQVHTASIFNAFPAGNTTAFFDKYGINSIIARALQLHNSSDPILDIYFNKATNAWTKTDAGYKSGKITILFRGAEGFTDLVEAPKTFDLSINGAPNGTKVIAINKTTNKEEDVTSKLKGLATSTYSDFYLVVPVGSVEKNKNYNMTLGATGIFKKYGGYYYASADKTAQRVTTIGIDTEVKSSGTDLALTITEDTALDVSQSIYFIGLIVLLSGLGILYANVKKQKEY